MNKVISYLEETKDELVNKVSWPSWKELQGSAIIVMIAAVIIALIVYVMDKSFSEILRQFYNTF
jgi:preprotein translocase subunit SecE